MRLVWLNALSLSNAAFGNCLNLRRPKIKVPLRFMCTLCTENASDCKSPIWPAWSNHNTLGKMAFQKIIVAYHNAKAEPCTTVVKCK